ncbi:hypothetical protein H4S03_007047 [Coemansia sp. S3946]|nr:hypothetical protein H4S03_007047 [Coemansia sp. S3946]
MPSVVDHSLMHLPPSDQKPAAMDLDSTVDDSGDTPAPTMPSPPDSTAPPAATPTKTGSKQTHRKRARATTEQVAVLESVFMVNRSPASRLREDLAARLGMAPRQVQVWFQNRRAKEKTQQRNPRPLQHHSSMLFDQLAYPSVGPDFYSMTAASSFLPIGADPASATGTPAAAQQQHHQQLQNQCQNQHQQQFLPHHSHIHHGMLDSQMALAAASATATTTTANPWMNWNMDMPPSPAQYFGMSEPHAMPPLGPAIGSMAPKAASSAGKAHLSSTASAASMHAANISDSRRESGASAITAVASPSASDPAAAATGSTAVSALNAGADATSSGPTAGHSAQLSHKSSNHSLPFSQSMMPEAPVSVLPDAAIGLAHAARFSHPALMPDSSASMAYPGCVAPPLGARLGGSVRRPAPLSLISGHNGIPGGNMALSGGGVNSGSPAAAATISGGGMLAHPSMHPGFHLGGLNLGVGLSMGIGMGMGMGYGSYIPEIPSYMVLDATQLVVGSWQRVPMPDTELTCLACVEPPPLKPVQRPGNHRPTELDSLVGEFQWIIGSCGGRYKMVLPYTAICRIKFREIPDRAASLLDVVTDSVVNTPAALSLLNRALKNPQAQGELSIHVYDLPTYYFQTESGVWTKIDDFSENMSASKTNVHTVSGSFASLYHQLRTLLATCSRLKSAADALMTLWMGNMDDPYSAIAGIPHNTWIPCAEAVLLHAPKLVSSQPTATAATTEPANTMSAAGSQGAADKAATSAPFNMCVPVSAASSTIGTLTPTPTSASCPQMALPHSAVPPALGSARNAVFAFHDAPQPNYHSSIAAAMTAAGSSGVAPLPLKTQRSASLPFIRLAANGAHANTGKVNPSSSLCRTIDGESVSPTEGSGDTLSQPAGSNETSGGDAPTAAGALAGLGISNTQALPLRHRTSCNHLRRPAPYQVAPGGSWANSPQMSPSPFWHAHSLRRASRDSLSGHHHSHSTLGSAALPTTPLSMTGPPCAFIRRESDAELALAMNHAFVNGDVLGAHRGIGDLYGGSAVPPSPLSNMTMAACASAMQVDSEDANGSAVDDDNASRGLRVPHTDMGGDAVAKIACQQSGMGVPALLPPNEVYGPTDKPYGMAVNEGMTMSNAEIVMAIFNAMSNAATSASAEDIGRALRSGDGQSLASAVPTDLHAAGMFDPTSFGYDPGAFMLAHSSNNGAKPQAVGGPHAMDWCFDWSHAAPCGPSGSVPELISTTSSNGLGPGKDDSEMRIDWTSSGDSTAVADTACPSSLAFGSM